MSSRSSPAEARGRTREQTADGIYGVIVSAAVMASAHADTVVGLEVAVLVTLVVYWGAERYARVVAARIDEGHKPTRRQLREELTSGWEIVTASMLPLLVLLGVGLLTDNLAVAVLAALVCSTLLLCLAGWEVGRRGKLTLRERIASGAVAGTFGVAMIVLKTLLH